MNDIDLAYLVFLFLTGWAAYSLGKKDGIGITLDYMKEQGKIDFED